MSGYLAFLMYLPVLILWFYEEIINYSFKGFITFYKFLAKWIYENGHSNVMWIFWEFSWDVECEFKGKFYKEKLFVLWKVYRGVPYNTR